MYLTLSSAGEKYHLREQTIRVGRESRVWKCPVSCGSKPIDPLVKCQQHFICEKCGQVYDVLVVREAEIKPARLSPGI